MNPGDKGVVRFNDRDYSVQVDQQGVLRFQAVPWFRTLLDLGIISLNQVCIKRRHGQISQQDYAELNMALGYSVSGFIDVMSSDQDSSWIQCPGEAESSQIEGFDINWIKGSP